jgi:hypothetical protein
MRGTILAVLAAVTIGLAAACGGGGGGGDAESMPDSTAVHEAAAAYARIDGPEHPDRLASIKAATALIDAVADYTRAGGEFETAVAISRQEIENESGWEFSEQQMRELLLGRGAR